MVDGVVDLLGRYLQLTDSDNANAWVDVFTENGTILIGEATFAGDQGLRDFFASVNPGVHSCGLPVVTVSADEATSACPYLYVNAATGAILAGHYLDRIDIQSKPYRFIERKIERRAQAGG